MVYSHRTMTANIGFMPSRSIIKVNKEIRMGKELKSQVRKALEEIKYDDWHKSVHTEAMFKAQKQTKPSDKEQTVAVMCGVCDEILSFRIPPTLTPITDPKTVIDKEIGNG